MKLYCLALCFVILTGCTTGESHWMHLAELGGVDAQKKLGDLYSTGQGVPKNYRKAISWYTLSGKQGNVDAQYRLGFLYSHGHGIPVDYIRAVKWYRRAAEQGHVLAQKDLGYLYYHHRGYPKRVIERNYQTAFKWLLLAAEQGELNSQFYMGTMYEKGQGITKDYVRALMWYSIAESNDDYEKNWEQEQIKKKMTPSQIKKALSLTREWKRKHNNQK